MTMSYCAGVDIGGTNTVIGLLDPEFRVVAVKRIPTLREQGAESLFDRIAESLTELLRQEGAAAAAGKYTLGMGVPGFVDPETGTALNSANLGWRGVPVAEEMRRRLGVAAAVDNDVRMYVYGEAMRGAGQGARHVLGVTIGTGLAAAYVSDGRLFYGGGNMAGELGHLPLDGIPYRCNCGLVGCLETVASGTGIARVARELAEQSDREDSLLRARLPQQLTAKDVSLAYDAGDPVAMEVYKRVGTMLGKGLAYAVTLFSPDRVVIGGGGAEAGERLLLHVRAAMQSNLIRDYWERIEVVPATLGDLAGVIGSAMQGHARAR